ncbi:MAG: hypothetical protein ABJE66_26595 [Deltaproteobacteria bacterium]
MAAATGFALAPGPHQDRTTIPARVDFHRTHCSGGERIESKVETVDQTLIANHEVDPYTPVFESAELTSCFGDESRIEMLVDIAADGHVTRVTHRPERPNRASRCIAHAVRHLQFPAADSPVSIRYAFTK